MVLVGKVVKGDGERVEVERVAVVDEEAVACSLAQLHAHLDRSQFGTAVGNHGRGIA